MSHYIKCGNYWLFPFFKRFSIRLFGSRLLLLLFFRLKYFNVIDRIRFSSSQISISSHLISTSSSSLAQEKERCFVCPLGYILVVVVVEIIKIQGRHFTFQFNEEKKELEEKVKFKKQPAVSVPNIVRHSYTSIIVLFVLLIVEKSECDFYCQI